MISAKTRCRPSAVLGPLRVPSAIVFAADMQPDQSRRLILTLVFVSGTSGIKAAARSAKSNARAAERAVTARMSTCWVSTGPSDTEMSSAMIACVPSQTSSPSIASTRAARLSGSSREAGEGRCWPQMRGIVAQSMPDGDLACTSPYLGAPGCVLASGVPRLARASADGSRRASWRQVRRRRGIGSRTRVLGQGRRRPGDADSSFLT